MSRARDNLAEALALFFETAGTEQIDRRLSGEIYVTQVEVSVGVEVAARPRTTTDRRQCAGNRVTAPIAARGSLRNV